jgi:hypothetical protein
MSGVVTAEGQELQVIVVDAEWAAWTPDRTARLLAIECMTSRLIVYLRE